MEDRNSATSNQANTQAAINQQTANDSFLPSPFRVSLQMKSDWHIGTGAGRPGSIDSLVARDADRFPFVPAKTLNGIWRDTLERVTLGLDNGTPGGWTKWVDVVFGNQPAQPRANPTIKPNPSLLRIQPARLSESLRAKICAAKDPRLLTVLTFIKPGVAIEAASGTAKPDFLRFEEMGRAGTVLQADCELLLPPEWNTEARKAVSALLLLSTRLVERLGGKRRRGAGRCELRISDSSGNEIDHQSALSWLTDYEKKTAPETPPTSSQADAFSLKSEAIDSEWQVIEFSLRLLTPVSVVTATLGNVSESLDFIPGTYLLPHVTKTLGRKLGERLFQAVAYGDLQVLPATVQINGCRGLPVPRVLAQHKVDGGFDKKGTVYNKLKDDINDTTPQLRPFRSGFVEVMESVGTGTKKLPSYKTTPMTLLMHNTVEDGVQRPTEAVGGVFSRQAIAAGSVLRGEIRLKKNLANELLDSLKDLEGTVRLGTSRKDDYGAAKMELLRSESGKDVEPKNVDTYPKLDSSDPRRLTVCLLSDCLLRGANLRQTNLAEDLAAELSTADKLDVRLALVRPNGDATTGNNRTTSLVMVRRIESWHERWGFPRPTLVAMSAGSCVVFDADRDLDLKKLKHVEAEGVGERRGEGYGQIRFNPPLLTEPINGWEPADKPHEFADTDSPGQNANVGGSAALRGRDEEFAKLIETVAWREALRVAVLKVANDLANRKEIFGFDSSQGKLPMSQVGGLRSAISRLRNQTDAPIVTGWLDHLKATPNRREKWAKSKRAAEDKVERIEKLISDESKVWLILCETKIGGTDVWKSPPTLVRKPEELRKLLWAEAVRSLFDACARAHKRDLER
jgi:CRISPR-associated protein Csx10